MDTNSKKINEAYDFLNENFNNITKNWIDYRGEHVIDVLINIARNYNALDKETCVTCGGDWGSYSKHCPQCNGKGYVYTD